MSDLMRFPGKWDFTVDFIAGLFVVIPAFYAYNKRIRGWKWIVGMALLPVLIILVAVLYFFSVNQYHDYQAKLTREHTYNSPNKIEKVVGIKVPSFKMVDYQEKVVKERYLQFFDCNSTIEWETLPNEHFYSRLDSLCNIEGSHWSKNDDIYLFDSISSESYINRIVLMLLITKNKKYTQISYHISKP